MSCDLPFILISCNGIRNLKANKQFIENEHRMQL